MTVGNFNKISKIVQNIIFLKNNEKNNGNLRNFGGK